ncbi:MAG: TraB/GumN family protein [Chthoniobacterales bacterium]
MKRAVVLLLAFLAEPALALAAAPVWKITDGKGGTLYLGGSVHALRKSDYPLPGAFDRALDASSHLVLEIDDSKLDDSKLRRIAEYPKGDSLRKHVDPRTYAYVQKFFGLLGVPEAKFSRFRPWALTLMLSSPGLAGLSTELGIEERLTRRAHAQHKPVLGLETTREHLNVFTGLSEKQSEGVLLLTFIPATGDAHEDIIGEWKRGEADKVWRSTRANFSEYPAFGERLIEARNRAWMPKIESYLRSGQTYFVVAGMGHMGGPEGVPALLRKRGYRVEQL